MNIFIWILSGCIWIMVWQIDYLPSFAALATLPVLLLDALNYYFISGEGIYKHKAKKAVALDEKLKRYLKLYSKRPRKRQFVPYEPKLNDWLLYGVELKELRCHLAVPDLDFVTRRALSSPYKELFQTLKDHEITAFYHFTDLSTCGDILDSQQLFSVNMGRKLLPELFSGELISHSKINSFVHTSFCKYHPKLFAAYQSGHIKTPVILEIDPLALASFDMDFFFTSCDILGPNCKVTRNINKLKAPLEAKLFFKSYQELNEQERQTYQAEIMFKNMISAGFIKRIYGVHLINDEAYRYRLLEFGKTYVPKRRSCGM